MPPKVVTNPYSKKRKAAKAAVVGGPSTRTTSSSSSRGAAERLNVKPKSSYGNTGKPLSTMGSSSEKSRATSITTEDALLPSNYAVVPGSFSQAFTSIDETEDFRRASESFENDIRDNKKRESFRLAKVIKGRRPKNKSIFEHHQSEKRKTNTNDSFSPLASNREGARTGKQLSSADDVNVDQKEQNPTASSNEISGDKKDNPSATINPPTTSDATSDVRIHHTMLQPHVLYVSTRQKGNSILPLIRNVPIAYSPMVPDYIFGPTSCALFLSIKYHKLYPRYIHRRIAEMRKDFKLRVLLVLVDVEDNANSLLQLNTIGVTNQLTVILCWSELEAARYLETYKARDGKDATPIQKREPTNPLDRVSNFLTSGRAGVNKTDAVSLWNQFSTVSGIASATPDELALVPGMGPVKVRRLHEAFHKPFSKLRSRARKKKQHQEDEEKKEAKEREMKATLPNKK